MILRERDFSRIGRLRHAVVNVIVYLIVRCLGLYGYAQGIGYAHHRQQPISPRTQRPTKPSKSGAGGVALPNFSQSVGDRRKCH